MDTQQPATLADSRKAPIVVGSGDWLGRVVKYVQDANTGLTFKMETTTKSPMVIETKTILCNEMAVVNGNLCFMPFQIPKI